MKRTKTKLISSITVLIVCFAMLIGSTFAWFTDSASTGVNKIQAGNLDIEVLHSNAFVTTAQDIQGVENMFLNSNGEEMKWEPGAVSYETITVSNKGNLALKYSLTFNVNSYNTVVGKDGIDTGKSLLDVLKVIVPDTPLSTVTRETVSGLDWANAPTLSSFAKANRELYPSTDTTVGHKNNETFQLIVYWPQSSNDNDYNLQNGKYASDSNRNDVGNLFIKMGINVDATQLVSEYDSFGNDYDKDALLPEVSITDAVKEGNNYIIGNGTYTNSSGNEVEVPKTVISDDTSFYATHDSQDAIVPQDGGSLSRKLETTVNDNNNTVNINVTFNYTTSTSSTEVKRFSNVVENVADIEKNLEIDKVTHEGSLLTMVSERPEENNRVDQTYYYDATEGLLYFYSKTYSDFEVTYIRYWKDDTASSLNIDEAKKTISISNAKELALLAKNLNSGTKYERYTITLENDIDLFGKRWTPIFEGGTNWAGLAGSTIDGKGYTIKNMFVYHETSAGFIGANASNLTIKNLSFTNSTVSTKANQSQTYAGVLMGKNYSPLTIENVNIDGARVTNNWQCGLMVGFAEGKGPVFKNCTVKNSYAGGYKATAGTLFGLGIVDVTVENCTAENISLYTDSLTWDSTAKQVGNFAVGHIYGKTLTTNNYTESNVKVVNG